MSSRVGVTSSTLAAQLILEIPASTRILIDPASLPKRLEGRVVVLEPLRRDHGPALFDAMQDPEIWRWLPIAQPTTDEAFASWLDAALANAEAGIEVPFAQLRASDGTPVGSTRFLAIRPEHDGVEIGWTWLAPDEWETGANIEAKLLLLRHAFETVGCMRVEFKTDARNERSRAALAALPAQFEGISRKHMLVRDGQLRDSAWYAVTDDDWPEVEAALEARLARKLGARGAPA
jgi:RimJ/RimL family protein N-acetyltransferase